MRPLLVSLCILLIISVAACGSSRAEQITPATSFTAEPTATQSAVATFTTPSPISVATQMPGPTGKGVIVAIVDRGIDWQHPDFIKPDGTTRIKWLLDMTGQNLCDGSNTALEYSESQINTALAGGSTIDSRDAVGHGTVTAGLAAGNGLAYANAIYRGVAPEADLVIVKLTSEGAPAHGDQPAEAAFQGCIEETLSWLDQKVTALNQPVVALINSGTQWGPIDGTSAVSRKIDEVFGADRPGRVYVAASGDEGENLNHSGGSYDNTADTVIRLNKDSTATSYMQLWYTGSQPAQITFTFDDGTTVGPVGPGEFIDQNGIYMVQYAPGQEFYPWQSTSEDRAVWISVTGHSGDGSIRIRGLGQDAGRFDVYGDLLGPNLTSIVYFVDHLVPGRLTDYASTQSAIIVGAHLASSPGPLWTGTSCGPTRDGRDYGIDISAPGHGAVAAYAPDSYWATFTDNLVPDGGGWYGYGGATSGAAPIVVGAVALMLEINPSLTANQVRQILRESATKDGYTGTTPNLCWGYGKLNIEGALEITRTTLP